MRNSTLLLAIFLVSSLAAGTAWAAGSKPAPPPPVASETSEAAGRAAYNLGLEKRDQAWELEEQAAASGAERQRLLGKARQQYEESIPLFESATEKVPDFHQAYSSLGYALRKTGDYEASLEAYEKALAIEPRYGEAIEYRGEAYLGLYRIDDAKQAYIDLFALDRTLADQLMEAMQAWLEARRADPAGVAADDLDAFGAWLAERAELAAQTARLTAAAERSWSD